MAVTNVGLNIIRDFVAGDTATAPTHIAVGNDDTAPLSSDTTLAGELQRLNIDTTSKSDLQVVFDAQLLSTDQIGESLKEVGLFNAALDGSMFVRSTHATISKDSTTEVQYFITLQFTT